MWTKSPRFVLFSLYSPPPSFPVPPVKERELEEEKQRASLANEAARVAVGMDPRMAKWFQMSQRKRMQQAGETSERMVTACPLWFSHD